MTTLARRKPQEDPFQLGDASLDARRRLEKQQIYLPPKPPNPYPRIPNDITELDDVRLMRLFTQLTQHAEYLSVQLACAEVDERYAESSVEKIRAIESLSGSSKSVTEAKAKPYQSDAFLGAREVFQTAHAYRKLTQVLYENADRFASLVSRELTRRVNREPREGRQRSWTT